MHALSYQTSRTMATFIQHASVLELLIEEQRDLLDTVDELRSMGVGRIVDLPQIIVVGDQSSGKSSVLEAISLVRFPVKGGLCTRFATELVLRKAQSTKFKVSITSGDSSEDRPQVGHGQNASVKRFNEASWENQELGNVIEEAKGAMGIGNSDHDFSDLVLRIEISKPEVPSLTLIDLPGFYHGETSEQSASGRKTVDKLARRYMERKNSIILAIVSGAYGLANQKVLNEARQHDPSHHSPGAKNPERTLGILTKPDTIAPGTDDEDKYLQLIQNKESANKLDLGWHVLRNRAGNETGLPDEDRDAAEADFLNKGVWKSVRPGDKGIKSLQSKLSRVLVDHIKKSLPSVRADIERNIDEKRRALKDLGTPRSSPEQIRQYLGEISGQVLRLSTDAIRGTGYSDPFFGDLHSKWSVEGGVFTNARRLRAVVRNLNQTFAAVMKARGETRSIIWEVEIDGDTNDEEWLEALSHKLRVMIREYKVAAPEPVDIFDLEEEIRSLALENLGSQFPGSPNDHLAVQLFKDQSHKWRDIAKQHLRLISAAGKSFTEAVVEHATAADGKTREAILVEIVDPFFRDREAIMEQKLQELLHHYTMGIPQPLDEEFQHVLSAQAKKRLADIVTDALGEMETISPHDVANAITDADDKTNEHTRVIDMMSAYYGVRSVSPLTALPNVLC